MFGKLTINQLLVLKYQANNFLRLGSCLTNQAF
jgi:hypothetical protein